MIVSYILLILAAASLVGIGICAWFGMKAAKEELDMDKLRKWTKGVVISGVCMLVFGGAYVLLNALGVFGG